MARPGRPRPGVTAVLCPAQAVQHAAFQHWFANSRAVDARGRPQLLFHGTEETFSHFDHATIRPSSRPAFWFASHAACGYYGPRRMGVYLSVPRVLEAPDDRLTHWVAHARRANMEALLDEQDAPVWDAVVFRGAIDGDTVSDVWAVFCPDTILPLQHAANPAGYSAAGVG